MRRLIDADAFRRKLDNYPPFDKETQDSNAMANLAKESLLVALNNMPTIDAEPVKHGKWILGKCNRCGEHAPFWSMATTYYESNFCPHCGARMDKDDQTD